MIREDKHLPRIIAASFLVSILAIRIAVWIAGSAESEFATAAKASVLLETQFHTGSNIILFGYHIHHFYFGILLLCVAGWLAIVGSKQFSLTHTAILLWSATPTMLWQRYLSFKGYSYFFVRLQKELTKRIFLN